MQWVEIHPEARGVEGLAGVRDEGSARRRQLGLGTTHQAHAQGRPPPVPVDEDTVPRSTRLRHDREQVAGSDHPGARRPVPPRTGVCSRPALRRGQSHDGREQPAPVHPDGGTPRAGHRTQRAGHGQSGGQRRLRRGAERIDANYYSIYEYVDYYSAGFSLFADSRSGPNRLLFCWVLTVCL